MFGIPIQLECNWERTRLHSGFEVGVDCFGRRITNNVLDVNLLNRPLERCLLNSARKQADRYKFYRDDRRRIPLGDIGRLDQTNVKEVFLVRTNQKLGFIDGVHGFVRLQNKLKLVPLDQSQKLILVVLNKFDLRTCIRNLHKPK